MTEIEIGEPGISEDNASNQQGNGNMKYDETLMYGHYTRNLGEFVKSEAAMLELKSDHNHNTPRKFGCFKLPCPAFSLCQGIKKFFMNRLSEDWLFLTLLGVIMALLSFLMDFTIEACQEARMWLYEEVSFQPALQCFIWIIYPLVFICFSTGFVHLVGPHAIGSGIPEMKTILRGVVLQEYLNFKTLVSKVVGLCSSLGSGLPIGKEGPFVHVASIIASLLGKFLSAITGSFSNETRTYEMLAAACAVGVACTFAAPIGGVLFSIEVTASYFAVRNYWRGFYSAVCGAFVFRLLAIFFKDEETLTALFRTNLRQDFPFDPVELIAFSVIGVVSGFAGAMYVFTHRKIVSFVRSQRQMSSFLQKNRFIFPSIVVLLISTLTFPAGLGQYMAGQVTNRQALNELFDNITWSADADKVSPVIYRHWIQNNIFLTLTLFIFMRFWMSALAITLPVPAGVFMPVFTIGAALGRLIGESMAVWFPNGLSPNSRVIPGGYAVVGAAALAGSVTHTVSTSVIVFELTGQMGHILPCVIAVLISNAIAHFLQPSIYDSLIHIKRLPYLPDIITARNLNAHTLCVEQFMLTDIKCLTLQSTFQDVKVFLQKYKFRSFPLIDAEDSRILLGSVRRREILFLLKKQLRLQPLHLEEGSSSSRSGSSIPGITITPPTPKAAHHDMSPQDPSQRQEHQQQEHQQQEHQQQEHQQQEHQHQQKMRKKSRFQVSQVLENKTTSTSDSELGRSPDESDHSTKSLLQKNALKVKKVIQKAGMSEETYYTTNILCREMNARQRAKLSERVNFDECSVDAAPLQLVERTSLYKAHSIFSLLSLHHAFVTNMGRLVGIVGLKEIRQAIQGEISRARSLKRSRCGQMNAVFSDLSTSDV